MTSDEASPALWALSKAGLDVLAVMSFSLFELLFSSLSSPAEGILTCQIRCKTSLMCPLAGKPPILAGHFSFAKWIPFFARNLPVLVSGEKRSNLKQPQLIVNTLLTVGSFRLPKVRETVGLAHQPPDYSRCKPRAKF